MTSTLCTFKRTAIAALFTGACISANAFAGYDIQTIDSDVIGFGSFSIEGNTALWTDGNNKGQLNYFDGNTVSVLVDSSTVKNYTGVSDGILFWTENTFESPAATDELFILQGGAISQVTNSGNAKSNFVYSDGQAAWLEKINGVDQVMFFDGVSTTQVTNVSSATRIISNGPNLQLDNGQIVWLSADSGAASVVNYWNGSSIQVVSNTASNAASPGIENGTVVWLGELSPGSDEVFQYQNGATTQFTVDGRDKNDAQIEDGIISWEVSTGTFTPAELWVRIGGSNNMISDALVGIGRAQIDDGKVVWTEGQFGNPSSIVELSNGAISTIFTGENPFGVVAEGGHILWRDGVSGVNHTLKLASPADDSDVVDLGPQHSFTEVTVNGAATVSASQFPDVDWSSNGIVMGFTSLDGQSLDGVVVTDEAGNTYPLTNWWGTVSQSYTGNARTATITAPSDRLIGVQWWIQ